MLHWVSDTLTGRTQVLTKAANEMLFRRWLNTLKELVEEYKLTVDVILFPSNKNMADRLTRVPQRWFTTMKWENGPKSDWRYSYGLAGCRPNYVHPQKQWRFGNAAYHLLCKENLPGNNKISCQVGHMNVWRMPGHRPSISPLVKRNTGGKW